MRSPSWASTLALNCRSSCAALIDQPVKNWARLLLDPYGPKHEPSGDGCALTALRSWLLSTHHVVTRTHTVAVSTPGKERTMLNAALGMLAMVPVVFAVAGYAMVSR
jgi:hypothetical protein